MGDKRKNVYSGSISYSRLWETMQRRGVTKQDLKKDFNLSPTLVNRLVKNENVAVDTIMYLIRWTVNLVTYWSTKNKYTKMYFMY